MRRRFCSSEFELSVSLNTYTQCVLTFIVRASIFSLVATLILAPSVNAQSAPPIAHIQNGGAPQIHGARVVGATPGAPFLFQVAATGDEPLLYQTRDLPPGLILDAQSGIIRGRVRYAGETIVSIRVSNALGVATRNLIIIGGRYQLAQTPPMGWNSWNAYGCGVSGARVRAAADDLVKTGLARRGYSYVNVDDCWQGARGFDGILRSNKKFGDMKALGDYLHARGLKFGIYSSPGPETCAGFAGSFGHEITDARTFANWGVDYLKYDYCSYDSVKKTPGQKGVIESFALMRQALDVAGRDIVYSVANSGKNRDWTWASLAPVEANLWRTTRDIKGSYASMARIGFAQNGLQSYAAPGRWNDPDLLYFHKLTPNQQLTQMTLWSLLAAPLFISSDISQLPPFALDVLGNSEVIEIDQDPMGIGARRVNASGQTEVWARPLWDGTVAVGLFNRGKTAAKIEVKWSDLGLSGALPVRDLWRQRDLGASQNYTAPVAAQGAALIKIGTPNARDYVPIWMR